MSELSANGKSLILKDMVVTHNQMDDSIIITSNEPDIKGQPFKLILNHSSETERTLRNLLHNNGLICEAGQFRNFPPLRNLTDKELESPRVYLGENGNGRLFWDMDKNAHLYSYESEMDSGGDIFASSVISQMMDYPNEYEVIGFDSGMTEGFDRVKEARNPNIVYNANYLDTPLNYAIDTMNERYEEMNSAVNPLKRAKDFKRLVVVLEEWAIGHSEHRQELERMIDQILRTGRTARVHLFILSTQVEVISRIRVKDCGIVVSFGDIDLNEAQTLFHTVPPKNTFEPVSGRGWISFNGSGVRMDPFQTYMYNKG